MRIAVPVWGEKVSPLLDAASRLLIVEADQKGEIARFQVSLDESEPSRKAGRIREMGVDVLICGAVSDSVSRAVVAKGIRIISEISGCAGEVVDSFLKGSPFDSRLLMPGCKRKRSHFRTGEISRETTPRVRDGTRPRATS
jgi:predicted Fe-Mo cluster-binding NifX family protein